jgi:hypothetical protein
LGKKKAVSVVDDSDEQQKVFSNSALNFSATIAEGPGTPADPVTLDTDLYTLYIHALNNKCYYRKCYYDGGFHTSIPVVLA